MRAVVDFGVAGAFEDDLVAFAPHTTEGAVGIHDFQRIERPVHHLFAGDEIERWHDAQHADHHRDRDRCVPLRLRFHRATGRFFRRSALPDTADAEAVSAKGSNGVIEVIIPKRPAALPRRISVTQ